MKPTMRKMSANAKKKPAVILWILQWNYTLSSKNKLRSDVVAVAPHPGEVDATKVSIGLLTWVGILFTFTFIINQLF
jgi:hypothetical protein